MEKRIAISSNFRENRIICECGEEILLVPDVKAMGEAIENHVALHINGIKDSEQKTKEETRIRDALIIQVFNLSSESKKDKTTE